MNYKIMGGTIAGAVVILGLGLYSGLWIQAHNFQWRSPVSVNSPLRVTKRVASAITIVQAAAPDSLPLNDNEKYLCQVFGQECKNALVIQHAENGTEQCDRFHINTNGTIDFGLMQVNSVHLKQGYTIAELIDCKQNIDIAYQIYKSSGWGAWTTAKQLGIK